MPRKGYRKPAHEARNIPVNVRLAPHEKAHLIKCVEASEVMGIADFLRQLIMQHEIKPRRPNSYSKLIDELARLNRKLASIDNNMNQLARSHNSGHDVSYEMLRSTLNTHKALRTEAADVLAKVTRRR